MSEISVVIPVYNTEKYLRECLDSVMNQTFKDLEIICINDGSTDNSEEILENYKKNDERIKIIHLPENRGLSYVRNRGLESAEGRYIYFLDSDDAIEENAMEILYYEAEKEKLDVIFFDAKIKYEDEKYKKKFETYNAVHKGRYTGVKTGSALFQEFVINQEWTGSVPRQFWRKDFLHNGHLNFYEGIIHEDELFAFKAIMQAKRVKFLKNRLFIRRFRDNSIMANPISDKNFYGYFTAFYLANKYVYENHLESDSVKKFLAILYGKAVRTYEATKKVYDLSMGFKEQELKNAYYFFVSAQNQYMAYGNFSMESIEKISRYEKIYIFGAGIIAKSVFAGLVRNNVIVQGFIVSEQKSNSAVVLGRPVVELEKVIYDKENMFVVVAVNRKHQEEIENKLIEANLNYMFYDEMEVL